MSRAWLSLLRPLNVLIALLAVGVGLYIARFDFSNWLTLALALLSAASLNGYSNVHNDALDASVDAKAHPERPLPRGLVTPQQAGWLALALLIVALAAAVPLGAAAWVIGLAALLVTMYNLWLKKLLLVGNLTVAVVGALAFGFAGLVATDGSLLFGAAVWWAMGLVFGFHLVREFVKSVEDHPGDSGERRTVGGLGLRAVWLARSTALLFAALSFGPLLAGVYNVRYLVGVVLFVDLPLLWALFYLVQKEKGAARAQRILKLSMLGALLSLAVGV